MALTYDLAPAPAASLGLIVLETDETLENEARSAIPREASLHHTRIYSAPTVTPETLAGMEADLPAAARTFPGHVTYDAIAYCCTSGATVIGQDKVAAAIRAAHPRAKTTEPITAVMAALSTLGAKRVGLLTPYTLDVSAAMQTLLEANGFEITAFGAFEEAEEAKVARISGGSTLAAMLEVGSGDDVEAVFASCTNLNTFGVIKKAEAALGKPVISSNSALVWHLARLAGLQAQVPGALGSQA